MASTAEVARSFTPTRYHSAEASRRERVSPAPAPEFVQRLAVARQFNAQLASRRLLDRETYRGLRKFIRCPIDRLELERNVRWEVLQSALQARQSWTLPQVVTQLRGMRENRGRALFHVVERGGIAVEYVGERS